MAAISRGRRSGERTINVWPGWVDALSSLVMVVIFVLMVFIIAQFYMSTTLSTRDQALTRLNRQLSELSDLLAMEREANADLRVNIAQLSAELQSSIPGVPDEYGLKATAFVDAGSVFRYSGSTASLQVANTNVVRSSVGAGLTWASPFGALTVDYAVPLSKAAYDVVQPLRFSAGPF